MLSHGKITVWWNSTVQEFKGGEGGMLSTVVVANVADPANVTELPAEAAFVAIGHSARRRAQLPTPTAGLHAATRARARAPTRSARLARAQSRTRNSSRVSSR